MEFFVIGLGAWIMLAGLVAIIKKRWRINGATSRYLELSVPGWMALIVGLAGVSLGFIV